MISTSTRELSPPRALARKLTLQHILLQPVHGHRGEVGVVQDEVLRRPEFERLDHPHGEDGVGERADGVGQGDERGLFQSFGIVHVKRMGERRKVNARSCEMSSFRQSSCQLLGLPGSQEPSIGQAKVEMAYQDSTTRPPSTLLRLRAIPVRSHRSRELRIHPSSALSSSVDTTVRPTSERSLED